MAIMDSMDNHSAENLRIIISNCVHGGNVQLLARASAALARKGHEEQGQDINGK